MLDDKNYSLIYSTEASGGSGYFGIRIYVQAARPLTAAEKEQQKKDHGWKHLDVVKIKALQEASYVAASAVEQEILAALVADNADKLANAAKEKADLFALFPGLIFGQDIPNGYCNQGCCRHLPWFNITTAIGVFKIGWRKRVINIDWSGTVCQKTGEELFPNEDVTKSGRGERYIHAWSLEKAKEYVTAIFTNVASLQLPAPETPKQLS